MTVVLALVMLPFASMFVASLLALRDGGQTPWRWVRILLFAACFLGLIVWIGDRATHAIGVALATVLVMQLAGYYAWRWWVIGVRR
jgi:hypothetical protein